MLLMLKRSEREKARQRETERERERERERPGRGLFVNSVQCLWFIMVVLCLWRACTNVLYYTHKCMVRGYCRCLPSSPVGVLVCCGASCGVHCEDVNACPQATNNMKLFLSLSLFPPLSLASQEHNKLIYMHTQQYVKYAVAIVKIAICKCCTVAGGVMCVHTINWWSCAVDLTVDFFSLPMLFFQTEGEGVYLGEVFTKQSRSHAASAGYRSVPTAYPMLTDAYTNFY